MHIRINIPAWGLREIAAGAASLFSGRGYRRRLCEEIERELDGWQPLLVSSARYGIALAARMLGLEGRRVAVPGYVCPAVLTGLRAAGVKIVAIDCQSSSVRFDARMLLRAASQGDIDGVLASDTYGLDQDFATLNRCGLPVIEDAAYQAGRKDSQGNLCGTRAGAGIWSFNFKSLTAVGGGVLIVREPCIDAEENRAGRLKEAIRFLNYAARSVARHRIPKFLPGAEAPAPGLDDSAREVLLQIDRAPMTELQSAIALAQWQSRARLFEIQKCNCNLLFERVLRCEAFTSPASVGGVTALLFPVLVRVSGETALAAVHLARGILHRRGVQTESPYPLLGSREELPNSYDLASRIILIPCNASLGEDQMRLVTSALEAASREVAHEFQLSRAETL